MSEVEIDLVAGEDSSGELVYERLPARVVEEGEYVVIASPVLVLGIAAGDRVRIQGGQFEVIERSGNLAIQVFGASSNEVAGLRESVARISGSLDGQDSKAAVFTVPVTAGFAAIEELFKKSGVEWYYGNVYADDGVTPLGWWDVGGTT